MNGAKIEQLFSSLLCPYLSSVGRDPAMEESGQWGRSKPANAIAISIGTGHIGISVGTAHCSTVASLWQCTSGHSCNAALRWNLDAGPGLRQLVVSAQRDQEWPIVGIT